MNYDNNCEVCGTKWIGDINKCPECSASKEQTNSWEEEFEYLKDNYAIKPPYKNLKQFISKTISQEREKIIEEINKLESENWQDTYEAGFEDAKEIIINLLQK